MQNSKIIKENKDSILEDIHFGTIVTGLLETPTVTDIKFWSKQIIIVDSQKGEYTLDLSQYSKEDAEDALKLVDELPRKIAIRMKVNFNKGAAILDGEMDYKNMSILRFNAINGVLTYGEVPALAIRKTNIKFVENEYKPFDEKDYAPKEVIDLLLKSAHNRANIVIAGETGAGKTTLLRYLAVNGIRENESVITIEDTFEAFLQVIKPKMKVLALKSNINYKFDELLRTSLRQDPSWILISESRGIEVIDLLAASSSGHSIITTVHASNARIIPWRMLDMSTAAGTDAERIFRQAHQNMDLGVFINYFNDDNGSHRRITEICEFYLDDNGKPVEHDIVRYDSIEKKYVYSKLESKDLIAKLLQRDIDLSKLKKVGLL